MQRSLLIQQQHPDFVHLVKVVGDGGGFLLQHLDSDLGKKHVDHEGEGEDVHDPLLIGFEQF